MIKVFHKIREKMLNQGKIGSYLKYAIGEIILVVIGILIALQVNNWNEERKNQQQLYSIYSAIEDDLRMDIKDINSVISGMQVNEPCFLQVINGEMTQEIYESHRKCAYILSGFPDISMRQNAFNLLSEFHGYEKEKQKETIKAINEFYTYYNTEIAVDQKSVTDVFNSRDAYWAKKYPWYSDYLFKKPNQAFIEYALNSYEYKNEVSIFYFVFFKLYVTMLKSYKQDALKLIDRMHSEVNL